MIEKDLSSPCILPEGAAMRYKEDLRYSYSKTIRTDSLNWKDILHYNYNQSYPFLIILAWENSYSEVYY